MIVSTPDPCTLTYLYSVNQGLNMTKTCVVLTHAHERGIKLNADKVKIGVTEIRYFGNILTQNGLKIDDKKLSAIRQWMLHRTDQC